MKARAVGAMTASAVGATKAPLPPRMSHPEAHRPLCSARVAAVVIKGTPVGKNSTGPKLVFAHYMVCNRDYGGSVAGYERDIQDAQAAGINGFALNCGSWNGGMYKGIPLDLPGGGSRFARWQLQAVLFSRHDRHVLCEVVQMMTAYASNVPGTNTPMHPNYWRIAQTTPPARSTVRCCPPGAEKAAPGTGRRPRASRTAGRSLVLNPLKAAGINTYFMPFFFMTDANGQYTDVNPSTVSAEVSGELSGLCDGFFYASSIGCPIDPAQQNVYAGAETYAAGLKAGGLGTMNSVTPQYWGSRQVSLGRRYLEYYGGEGLAAQWNSIINVQKPDWVECFTWNDFDEATYFTPIDDVNKYWPWTVHPALGFYKTHAGALKLNQYFMNWYKSGVKPTVTNDSIYCFYRTHPRLLSPATTTSARLTGSSGTAKTTSISRPF
ncbi:MAG: hypothetical protein FRX48_09091 [Lasallia pustulata]|uniref:Glycoside hydrolase family 71 n=1 Tax=Lasallia pustulata TaxID=136370 RepID=A0A5M8PCS0_9LECA|nr:MAG: hypothetical protein FRX48_09091 [Lasallia pustulata]